MSLQHGASSGCGWRRPIDMEGRFDILSKQKRQTDNGWSSRVWLGVLERD